MRKIILVRSNLVYEGTITQDQIGSEYLDCFRSKKGMREWLLYVPYDVALLVVNFFTELIA